MGRSDLLVQDWQELNRSLFSAMALEKIAVFIALLCVILVASFGILGSNLMSVLEKAKEIAILKTMGCTDRLIQSVFIAEGLCLGVLGGALGILSGIGLCLVLDRFGLPLGGSLQGFEELPVAIDPLEVLLVGISSLAIVWLSSLYPARVASRMRPGRSTAAGRAMTRLEWWTAWRHLRAQQPARLAMHRRPGCALARPRRRRFPARFGFDPASRPVRHARSTGRRLSTTSAASASPASSSLPSSSRSAASPASSICSPPSSHSQSPRAAWHSCSCSA
jgi:hypothetical protein